MELKLPLHLKSVVTLPCEKQVVNYSGAHQFDHKRSGAQTSDYSDRNARSTAHKNVSIRVLDARPVTKLTVSEH